MLSDFLSVCSAALWSLYHSLRKEQWHPFKSCHWCNPSVSDNPTSPHLAIGHHGSCLPLPQLLHMSHVIFHVLQGPQVPGKRHIMSTLWPTVLSLCELLQLAFPLSRNLSKVANIQNWVWGYWLATIQLMGKDVVSLHYKAPEASMSYSLKSRFLANRRSCMKGMVNREWSSQWSLLIPCPLQFGWGLGPGGWWLG